MTLLLKPDPGPKYHVTMFHRIRQHLRRPRVRMATCLVSKGYMFEIESHSYIFYISHEVTRVHTPVPRDFHLAADHPLKHLKPPLRSSEAQLIKALSCTFLVPSPPIPITNPRFASPGILIPQNFLSPIPPRCYCDSWPKTQRRPSSH
jgi:hypothetical protein